MPFWPPNAFREKTELISIHFYLNLAIEDKISNLEMNLSHKEMKCLTLTIPFCFHPPILCLLKGKQLKDSFIDHIVCAEQGAGCKRNKAFDMLYQLHIIT